MAEGEKNLDAVMDLLRAHVDLDEEDVGTRKDLATMYAQHGRPDDELAMLEQMRDIVADPERRQEPSAAGPVAARNSALALNERLGEMYLERKRYEDAELAYACAIGVARMDLAMKEQPPSDPPVVAELLAHHAETLHLLGKDEDARARIEEAKRLDPENETVKKVEETLHP